MNPITSEQLAPTTKIKLPPATTPDFSSYLTVSPIQQQELDTAKKSREKSYEDLVNEQVGLSTRGERTLQYEEDAGLPKLNKDLTEIENQLRQTDFNFRQERERLQTEPGLTSAQRNARLADVSRKQSSELANLEVIRQARSGVLADVQSNVQRKTELEFMDEQARIDNLKYIYENNTGDLKDKMEQVYKREERAFQVEKDKYQTTEAEKINLVRNAQANGASNSVMSAILNSKTIDEAYKNAGSYGMSIDDKIRSAQLRKLNQEIQDAQTETPESEDMDKDTDFKKLKGLSELEFSLKAYDNKVKDIGAKKKGTAGAGELDALYQEVLQAYRAAKDLGAIQGADLNLVDDAIKRATFERSAVGNTLGLGIPALVKKGITKRGAESSINTVYDIINNNRTRQTGIIQSKKPEWVSTPYFQAVTGVSGQDYEIEYDDNGNIIIPGEVSNEDFFK